MVLHRARWAVWLFVCVTSLSFASQPKSCVSADDAALFLNKDVCVAAHVYGVVQLSDGTRYLDTCAPGVPDAKCSFTVQSLWKDHKEVGELSKYRDMDVKIRGIIRPMSGRAGMMLSHAQQFSGGPPKFRPNPRLLHGFDAEDEKPAASDPNLRQQGGRRAFMNTKDQIAR